MAGEGRVWYAPSQWVGLQRSLKRLRPTDRDVFLDAGAGKGRVLLVAATHPFRRVIGVELAEDLAAVGRRTIERNRDRLRCGNVRMVTGDILDYEIPDDVSVVYLFSPFLDHVFRGFFEALTASVDRSPRPVHLLYNYPSEHVYLLSTGRVRVEDVLSSRWPPRSRKRSEVIVTYRVLTREQAEDGGALWAEIPRRLRRPRHWLGPYDPGYIFSATGDLDQEAGFTHTSPSRRT
jgi:SAM-dependent methyltransferase